MSTLFKFVILAIKKIGKLIILSRYNNITIAKYFRKQGVQIGERCSILIRSLGDEPYLVKIGNHVTIAKGVNFITHDGGAWIFREEVPDIQVFGPIIIDDNCVIGQNAILFPNIHIGKNSIVGAGAVVITDIPPSSIAVGIPARVLSSVEKYKNNCIAKWNEQKPPDIIIEEGHNWWNSKYYKENRKKLRRHLVGLFWKENEAKEGK